MIKAAIEKSDGFDELDKVVFKAVTTCICSLALSELDNSETQPLHDCFNSQIQNIVRQRSVELKRYDRLIKEARNSSLPFSGSHETEGTFYVEQEESKLCDVI